MNALHLAHHFISQLLKPGDVAVDATAGNGNDTLFLAQLVGEKGSVFAFDTQPIALFNTAQKLRRYDIKTPVYLINAGHEKITDYISSPISAVMFNLGYLPGSGKNFATQPATTISALEQAARLLLPGGIITVVVYTGHEGALSEQSAVDKWFQSLPASEWTVLNIQYQNWINNPPYLVVAYKAGKKLSSIN